MCAVVKPSPNRYTIVYTLPLHALQSSPDPTAANKANHELNLKVSFQHFVPSHAVSSGPVLLAATKAYRYENNVVPVKGAYEITPKFLPKLGSPQMEERMPGLHGQVYLSASSVKTEKSRGRTVL